MLPCYLSDDTGWGVLRAWPVKQACSCGWQGRFIFDLKLTCTLCVSYFARHFAEFKNTTDSLLRSARINKLFWRDVCNIFVTRTHTHTHTWARQCVVDKYRLTCIHMYIYLCWRILKHTFRIVLLGRRTWYMSVHSMILRKYGMDSYEV